WLLLAVAGMGLLVRYSMTPGRPGHAPSAWPAGTSLERPAGEYTLVLALHPHCPCSRATLEELDAIMGRCRGRLVTRVLFLEPPGFTEGWAQTDLWRHSRRIPGVESRLDPGGRESRMFGALTSGQTALYAP